jgi:hypothetical protein
MICYHFPTTELSRVWREHWLHDPPATLDLEKVPIPALRGKIHIKNSFSLWESFFVFVPP